MKAFPAVAIDPCFDLVGFSVIVTFSKPAFSNSTVMGCLRGRLKDTGVTPVSPVDKWTLAPGGFVSMRTLSVVPRTTVAHPLDPKNTPTMRAPAINQRDGPDAGIGLGLQ